MRKLVLASYVASIAMAISLVGCSSDQSLSSKSKSPWTSWTDKFKKDSDVALSGEVDYDKPYDEYASELSSRPMVSPALGLDGEPKESSIKRMASSVASSTKKMTSSVTDSVKRGARKAGDVVAPRDPTTMDPISVNSPTGKPDASFFVSIARVQEVAGNVEGAESSYKQALDTDKKDLEALLSYAHLMDRQGRLSEATELYQQATKYHPDSATALNDLSICYARQGMMGPSVDALSSAIKLEPQRKLYRNNIAKVLVKMDRVDEAYDHLAMVHGSGIAHYNIGYLLHEMGNNEAAIRHFGYAAAADPSLVEAQRWQHMLAGGQAQGNAVAADQRYHMVPQSAAPQGTTAVQATPVSSPLPAYPGFNNEYRGPLVTPNAGANPASQQGNQPAYGNSLY